MQLNRDTHRRRFEHFINNVAFNYIAKYNYFY